MPCLEVGSWKHASNTRQRVLLKQVQSSLRSVSERPANGLHTRQELKLGPQSFRNARCHPPNSVHQLRPGSTLEAPWRHPGGTTLCACAVNPGSCAENGLQAHQPPAHAHQPQSQGLDEDGIRIGRLFELLTAPWAPLRCRGQEEAI